MGKQVKEASGVRNGYLFLYNIVQAIGWFYVLVRVFMHITSTGSYYGVWTQVSTTVKIFQTFAYLEVIHCIARLVPSSPFLTFIQISSRVVVVWGILSPIPEVINTIGVPLLLVAWSLAELTRYLYYAGNIANFCPYALVWCRYTFFYILYPAGVTGELLSMWLALPYIKERNLYSILMPNPANFNFSYAFVIQATMLSYIPGFPVLFSYMLKQRAKILGSARDKATAKNE